MADELKQLPSSTVAALLRQAQEAARGVGDDESRSWWLRGPAKVADALIGRAPEHFDDVASGMFRLKRPSYQQSWAGANEPLVDALGITPTPGVGTASLMGAKMLRAVGREDEFRQAMDTFRRTKTPPPGWVVHPGSPRGGEWLMKYEPPQFNPSTVRALEDAILDSRAVSYQAEDVVGDTDFVKAFNRTNASGKPLQIVVDPDKSRTSLGTFRSKDSSVVLRPRLGDRIFSSPAAVKETIGHELTHAGQEASGLPSMLRGANRGVYTYDDTLAKWLDSISPVRNYRLLPENKRGGQAVDIGGLGPTDAAAAILRRQFEDMRASGLPMTHYQGNPGEAAARAVQEVEVARERGGSQMSEAMVNRLLQNSMENAHLQAGSQKHSFALYEEMKDLIRKFNAQQALKGTPP
jgi:hypothetical protein